MPVNFDFGNILQVCVCIIQRVDKRNGKLQEPATAGSERVKYVKGDDTQPNPITHQTSCCGSSFGFPTAKFRRILCLAYDEKVKKYYQLEEGGSLKEIRGKSNGTY